MGNEMGNNNTSAIKEEDNISEAEKKTLLQDTSELANGISQDVDADSVKEQNQPILTYIVKDVMEKSARASNDTTTELGKETWQEDSHADDAKGKIETVLTAESNVVQEKATWFASKNTSMHSLEGDTHAGDASMEYQISTSEAEEIQEKPKVVFPGCSAIEHGKDTLEDDSHADNVKEEIHVIPTAEANDVQEEATGLISDNTASMLENDSLEGDTNAMNMENQIYPTSEAEDVQEKPTVVSPDCSEIEHGKVTVQHDSYAENVKEEIRVIPTAEVKDVQEEAKGLISNNTSSMLENDSLEGYTNAGDVNIENQMHPEAEAEDGQQKATGLASEYYTISSLEKDLLKGDAQADDVNVDHEKHLTAESKEDQEIASKSGFDDKTSEPQEDKDDKDVIPMANGTDVQGKITNLASDDPLNLRNSFGDAVLEITEARQPKKSPKAGSAEAKGENYEILSSSLLEGTEECEKQKESCLRKLLLITYNHPLDNEPSIIQGKEETMLLSLKAVDVSNDSEFQDSSSLHSDRDELVEVLSEESHQDNDESLQKDNFLDTNYHFVQIKDDVLEKEMESQEKILCTDKSGSRDGNEFGNGLIDTSGITSDSPSVGNNNNGNIFTKFNYITEDSLISLPESFVMCNPLKSDHEENCKVLCGESTMRRNESTMENLYDYNLDHCMDEKLEEFKASMVNAYIVTTGSNGDCNGERNTELASDVSGIANTDQVREPKVTETGFQLDACVNNYKASDGTSIASEQKHSVVPEAEMVFLTTGSTVVDEKGDKYKIKIEETNGKQEASYGKAETSEGTEMSEQCNSDMVTINQEESFTLQNSSSLLYIYNCHQGNVKQTKNPTATSMPDSDWKQTNDNKYFGATIENLDSSNLEVTSRSLVDDETFENEGEDYSQHMQVTSMEGTELTTSAAIMSTESCLNNSILASGVYETREIITRLSTESEPDNPNISSRIQKSPSFNLNLRTEARLEESDQAPLLYQDKLANESLSNQASLNLIKNSASNDEYGECMLQRGEMPVEEKIVTMERSYSEKSKAPFIGLLEEEEEIHLVVKPHTQDNNAASKKAVKEVSSTSPKGKEKHKPRSSFFSSCMCCATVAN